MNSRRERLQIGEFAELVGLSIHQLRRYDRLQLLAPEGRNVAGYRYYNRGQTGAGRVIALLRSIDMPIADIRQVLGGIKEADRQQLFSDHRSRLETRLDEARRLLDAVDQLTAKGPSPSMGPSGPATWLHFMPHLPVSDVERSGAYYQEAGAIITEPVATRPYGMRDFTVSDPDGHLFTLGRDDESLNEVANY